MKMKRTGFSLLEICIVIAVLAIVAAIVLPSFLHNSKKELGEKENTTEITKNEMGKLPDTIEDRNKLGDEKVSQFLEMEKALQNLRENIELNKELVQKQSLKMKAEGVTEDENRVFLMNIFKLLAETEGRVDNFYSAHFPNVSPEKLHALIDMYEGHSQQR